MEIQHFAIMGVSTGAFIYLCGWIYVGALHLKWWICDEEGVHHCRTSFAKWIHNTFKIDGQIEFGTEWFIACFITTISLMTLSIVSYFPIGRMIVAAIGGVTAFIFIGSHTARWMMRTKKAISKVKNLSHEHKEI